MVEVWPCVKVVNPQEFVRRFQIEDLSKIWIIIPPLLPFNLRAFAGQEIRLDTVLCPAVNAGYGFYSNLFYFAWVRNYWTYVTSGASSTDERWFATITYTPPDVDDELNETGSGYGMIYLQTPGPKQSLVDVTKKRFSSNGAVWDYTTWETTSTTWVTRLTVDLGEVKSFYIHNVNELRLGVADVAAYYQIQYSEDGEVWTTWVTRSHDTSLWERFLERGFLTARYVRWQQRLEDAPGRADLRILKVWLIG